MNRLGLKVKGVLFGSLCLIGFSLWASPVRADVVVYSDTFAGLSSNFLNGAAPATSDNSGGEIGTDSPMWMAGDTATGGSPGAADFKADGSVTTGSASTFAYLPFTPQIGSVYQYSLTLGATQTGANASRWIAMGFTQTFTNIRWVDSGTSSSAWLLHRAGGYNPTTTDQAFIGPDNGVAPAAGLTSSAVAPGQDSGTLANISNPVGSLTLTPVDVIITLDTTSPNWVVTWQMQNHNNPTGFSTVRGALQYAGIDPTIHYVGLMALNAITAKASNLQLTRLSNASPTWNVDSDGTWTTGGNWLNSVPNATAAVAEFGTTITSPHTVTLDANQTAGVLLFTSPISYTIASTNNAAINIDGGATRGGINVAAGSHTISAPITQTAPIDIAVADGASVTLSGHDTLAITNLNLTGSGTLDLANSSLVFNYTGTTSPLGTLNGTGILAKLKSGYNGGSWNGNGISSSTAAGDPTAATALGYVEATALGVTNFQGQNIASKAVLVKYTYYGDSTLDGTVDLGNDFNLFLQGFLGNKSTWEFGDYNYDGVVDSNDFQLFVNGFASQGGSLGDLDGVIAASPLLSEAQKASLIAVVPEPTSLAVLVLGACLCGSRRKRQ